MINWKSFLGFFMVVGQLASAQSIVKNVNDFEWTCDCSNTINIGDTLSYYYAITNTGNQEIRLLDSVSLDPQVMNHVMVVNDQVPDVVSYDFEFMDEGNFISFGSLTGNESQVLAPGDTVLLGVVDRVDEIHFKAGNNSLVIWPENLNGETIVDSIKLDLVVVDPNKIIDFDRDNQVSIYPNPSNGIVNLKSLPSESQYHIYNSMGILVQAGNFKNSIQVSNLPFGAYTVSVLNQNSFYSGKLIVRK